MKKLIVVFLVLSILSLFIGVSNTDLSILLYSRLPRYLSIVFAGIGLSISGLIMQQISRNKFAAPSTTGVIDSTSLGIVLSLVYFPDLPLFQKLILIFLVSIVFTKIFLTILDKIVIKNAIFIPLLGIMYGKMISTITSMISFKYDISQDVQNWLYGDFSSITQGRYELLYIILPFILIAYLYSTSFTIIGFGKDFADNLGIKYNFMKNLGLAIVTFLTSSIVAVIGVIPFLGLIVPNLITLINGDNVKANLPYLGILGSIILLFCDIFGRLIVYPYEIPVSLSMGIIGSGVFLYFIIRGIRNVY